MATKGTRAVRRPKTGSTRKTADELAVHFEKCPLPHLEIGQDHGPHRIPTVTPGPRAERDESADSKADR